MTESHPTPTADDIQPVEHETRDRNNHHAFPTSAAHGLRWWQVDVSALVITAMEKLGLVWDVLHVSPERQARKAAAPA